MKGATGRHRCRPYPQTTFPWSGGACPAFDSRDCMRLSCKEKRARSRLRALGLIIRPYSGDEAVCRIDGKVAHNCTIHDSGVADNGAIVDAPHDEMDFLEALNSRGEIVPELLTGDEEIQSKIRRQPGLLWKAQNVRQHRWKE